MLIPYINHVVVPYVQLDADRFWRACRLCQVSEEPLDISPLRALRKDGRQRAQVDVYDLVVACAYDFALQHEREAERDVGYPASLWGEGEKCVTQEASGADVVMVECMAVHGNEECGELRDLG